PVTHLKRRTFEVLRKFVASGGKVIADTLLPVEFLETPENGAVEDVKKLFGVDPLKRLTEFRNGSERWRVVSKGKKGKVHTFVGKGLHRAKRKEELRNVLRKCVTADVTIADEEVFYLHRIKDGHDVYFFVNTTKSEKKGVEVTFERVGRPGLWNPNTGETNPLPVFEIIKGRLKIQLDFPPSESHVVVLGNGISKPYLTKSSMTVLSFDGKSVKGSGGRPVVQIAAGKGTKTLRGKAKQPLKPLAPGKPLTFETEQHNVLCLGSWKMRIEQPGEGNRSGLDVDDSSWLAVTNGAWETQLPQERDATSYPVALWYRTAFMIDGMPPALRLIIDGFSGKEHRLFVNGAEVKDKGTRSYLDAEMKEVDIHRFAHTGRNVIAVRLIVQRRTDGILDLLKILGPFALKKSGNEYVVTTRTGSIKAGDWTKQGYPYFSGTGVYRTEFIIPQKYTDGRMFFEADCGEDVLEVSVNGSSSHMAPWHPYRIEITDAVRQGVNSMEIRVTNSLINILEAVEKPSGLMAAPRLVHEHVYELALKP
ncbi:MAG TPA: glycosyl hydrolase, partial [Bacteroidota bacterium]